jgi:DNA-binding CsgD family transcriptional regulator
MAMAADRIISCPVLVGREETLELGARRMHSVLQGEGQLLLVAGEAGIGKTRLLGALMRRATRDGAVVIAGAAFPRDVEVAGAALIDLARSLVRDPAERFSAIGTAILGRLLDESDSTADAHRRRRLLVIDLADDLAALTTDTAVLLALEDLHWSDELTLDVLAQLARRVRDLPMLVVATYRSDELYPRVPMRQWRSRLVAQRLAEEVRLPRMTPEQTATMVSLLLGGDLPPAATLIAQVQQRTDGIPLYIEEIVGGLGSGSGGGVPDTLVDAVASRSAALSPGARDVAAAAAVIGRRFDVDLLAAVLDEAAEQIDPAMTELEDHFFVAPAASGATAFDFRHALIRDALYARVPVGRRRALHGRIAEAAAARGASTAFLSAHFEQAGQTTTAHGLAVEAGRRSARLGAHREALDLFRRALRTAPDDQPLRERADVLVALAAEAMAADDNELAADSYRTAIEFLQGCGAELDAAGLAPDLVAARHLLGDDLATRLRTLHGALEVAERPSLRRSLEARRVRCRILAGISAAYMLDRHLDESIAHGRVARKVAAEVGDEATELDASVTIGSDLVFAGRMEEGWATLEEGVRRSTKANREAQAARTYRMIASCASVLVEYERAESLLRDGIGYAERVELWNHRHYLAAHLAHVLWATGRWDAAARMTEQALADGRGGVTTRITALYVRGYLALGRGAWQEADTVLAEARQLGEAMGELQRLSPALWGLAESAQLQGRDRAAVELCRIGRDASAAVGDAAYLFPFLVTGTRALIAQGDLTAAEHWVDDVSAELLRRAIPGTLPAVDHAAGLLALASGATRRAEEALRAARDGWTARRRSWEGTAVEVDLAACALRSNRVDEAVQLATQAAAAATTVGALPLLRRAEAALRLAQRRGGSVEAWAPLTAREFAVARLVAEGRTNPEIAAELRIARKTVAAHVEHILSRLGVGRRAQIAAWVATVNDAAD